MNTDTGAKWRSEHVDSAMFYTNKDIDKLIQDTENAFIQDLEAGDRQKAMKRLRVPPLGDKQSPWTTFKVCYISYLNNFIMTPFTEYRHSKFYIYDQIFLLGRSILWSFHRLSYCCGIICHFL